MRDWIRIGVILAVVGVGGWYGWHWLFLSDEAEIEAVLDRIAESVQAADDEGAIGGLARAALLGRELAPNVTIDAGPPFQRLTGRESIIATAARLRGAVRNLEIHFPDIAIDVAPDRQSAAALVTAEARFVEPGAGRGVNARELEIGFVRLNGDWVIATVSLVRPLERLDGR